MFLKLKTLRLGNITTKFMVASSVDILVGFIFFIYLELRAGTSSRDQFPKL